MDTSKEYVKMCDCPEVQGTWEPKVGDSHCYWPNYNAAESIPEDYKEIIKEASISTIISLEDVECPHCEELFEVAPFDKFTPQDDHIFLPRQDQIQEWLYDHFGNTDCYILFERCFGWVWTDDTELGQKQTKFMMSLEQLWLAFYMHEKHGLAWTGEKWE